MYSMHDPNWQCDSTCLITKGITQEKCEGGTSTLKLMKTSLSNLKHTLAHTHTRRESYIRIKNTSLLCLRNTIKETRKETF